MTFIKKYCNMHWVQPPEDVPVIASSAAGDSILMTTLFGNIYYSCKNDSESLATYLEQAAQHVRSLT